MNKYNSLITEGNVERREKVKTKLKKRMSRSKKQKQKMDKLFTTAD